MRSQTTDRGQIMLREAGLQWAQAMQAHARDRVHDPSLPYEILALRANHCALVALAGETFIELAQDIEARSPFARTMVLGYSNGLPGGHPGWEGRGAVGYLPAADAYPHGGYEVDGAIRFYGNLMFAPSAAQVVCDRAVEMLKSLK